MIISIIMEKHPANRPNIPPDRKPDPSESPVPPVSKKRFWEGFLPIRLRNLGTPETVSEPMESRINIGITTDPLKVIEFKHFMDSFEISYEIYEKVPGHGYISFKSLSDQQRSELFKLACEIGSEWNTNVDLNPKKQYKIL